MTTYKEAGVDIKAGDRASTLAYTHAASTFKHRKGKMGQPVFEENGYAGLLDMGRYYLVQTDDGVGSKMDIACALGKFETIGTDLLAMVADDAVCTGAEVMSVSNTLDVPKVEPRMVDELLKGLAQACKEQHIVIPAGEIAEVPGCVNTPLWNATAVGIVEKKKVIHLEQIRPGDSIIALREHGVRCNGFSLMRTVLKKHMGEHWYTKQWKEKQTWGDALLTPSTIYHSAVLKLLGRFKEPRTVNVHGIAHITGGGIPSKLRRVLKKSGCGARLSDLWAPPAALLKIMELGNVSPIEAYRTWSMGNGMLLIVPASEGGKACALLKKSGVEAKVAGKVIQEPAITILPPNIPGNLAFYFEE